MSNISVSDEQIEQICSLISRPFRERLVEGRRAMEQASDAQLMPVKLFVQMRGEHRTNRVVAHESIEGLLGGRSGTLQLDVPHFLTAGAAVVNLSLDPPRWPACSADAEAVVRLADGTFSVEAALRLAVALFQSQTGGRLLPAGGDRGFILECERAPDGDLPVQAWLFVKALNAAPVAILEESFGGGFVGYPPPFYGQVWGPRLSAFRAARAAAAAAAAAPQPAAPQPAARVDRPCRLRVELGDYFLGNARWIQRMPEDYASLARLRITVLNPEIDGARVFVSMLADSSPGFVDVAYPVEWVAKQQGPDGRWRRDEQILEDFKALAKANGARRWASLSPDRKELTVLLRGPDGAPLLEAHELRAMGRTLHQEPGIQMAQLEMRFHLPLNLDPAAPPAEPRLCYFCVVLFPDDPHGGEPEPERLCSVAEVDAEAVYLQNVEIVVKGGVLRLRLWLRGRDTGESATVARVTGDFSLVGIREDGDAPMYDALARVMLRRGIQAAITHKRLTQEAQDDHTVWRLAVTGPTNMHRLEIVARTYGPALDLDDEELFFETDNSDEGSEDSARIARLKYDRDGPRMDLRLEQGDAASLEVLSAGFVPVAMDLRVQLRSSRDSWDAMLWRTRAEDPFPQAHAPYATDLKATLADGSERLNRWEDVKTLTRAWKRADTPRQLAPKLYPNGRAEWIFSVERPSREVLRVELSFRFMRDPLTSD